MKQCITCGLEKPQDAFPTRGRDSEKRRGQCRVCITNRERQYRQANREAIAERNRKWEQANREARTERKRKYREANPETVAEYGRKYRQANREAIAETQRKWYEENREAIAKQKRQYQQANREARAEKQRKYRQQNPEVMIKAKHARRARKSAAVESRWRKSAESPGKCYWCGKYYGDSYHLDHIKPLSLHGPDRDYNIVKTCPTCNCTKGGLHPLVWIAKLLDQA